MLRRPDARRGLSARTAEVLGVAVGVAVPVQRHPPAAVLAACGLELLAVAALVLTGSLVALGAVVATAVLLALMAATNHRRVLAVTRGEVVVLAATLRRRPLAPIGPVPAAFRLPAARGVGAPLDLGDGRWWVDRSDYGRLRIALEMLSR